MHSCLEENLPVDRIEVCFNDTETEFYKPAPGMLLRSAAVLSIDLRRSFMVGDRWRDLGCGIAAGCTTILVDHCYEEQLRYEPDYRVYSMLEAATLIIGVTKSEQA